MKLTLVGQGEEHKIHVVYHNRKGSELAEKFKEDVTIAEMVAYLVKSWDIEYAITSADLEELEDSYPGTLVAVMEGFNQARTMAKAKN